MNNCLKKILIAVIAFCCAFSVQLSVNAIDLGDVNLEDIQNWLTNVFNTTAPTENPNDTTAPNNNTQPTDNTTNNNIVTESGTGAVTPHSTNPPTQYPTVAPPVNTAPPTEAPATTEPSTEASSLSFEASLSDLFEDDSAAILIDAPEEPFTLGGVIVDGGNNKKDDFTWQKAALIAVAVLVMVLLALICALFIQRAKKAKEEEYSGISDDNSEPSGPVPVEVMTPERIAELLGASAAARNTNQSYSYMGTRDSVSAIKAAALMEQFNPYTDPLIRKYTDEPVVISPSAAAALDLDTATAEDVLKATDSMLNDITGEELFAADTSGYSVSGDTADAAEPQTDRICPECSNAVPADDVFCHSCGAYIG